MLAANSLVTMRLSATLMATLVLVWRKTDRHLTQPSMHGVHFGVGFRGPAPDDQAKTPLRDSRKEHATSLIGDSLFVIQHNRCVSNRCIFDQHTDTNPRGIVEGQVAPQGLARKLADKSSNCGNSMWCVAFSRRNGESPVQGEPIQLIAAVCRCPRASACSDGRKRKPSDYCSHLNTRCSTTVRKDSDSTNTARRIQWDTQCTHSRRRHSNRRRGLRVGLRSPRRARWGRITKWRTSECLPARYVTPRLNVDANVVPRPIVDPEAPVGIGVRDCQGRPGCSP